MYWFDSPVRGMSRTTVGAVGARLVSVVVVGLKMEPERRPEPEVGRGSLWVGLVVGGLVEGEWGVLVPAEEGFLVGGWRGGVSVSMSIASEVLRTLVMVWVGGEGWGGWKEVATVAGGVMRGRLGSGGRDDRS